MPPGEQPTALQSRGEAEQAQRVAAIAREPYLYDFFQAVRLLMRGAARGRGASQRAPRPVGHDFAPASEAVRFRALPSHTFPPAEITAFAPPPEFADAVPPEMTVAFFGLFGPVGALPQHYTQTVIDRLRLKDATLRDFLDLFNHRSISLFYRAWEKHRLPPLLERAQAEGREDAITRGLYSFLGMGAPALRGRLETPDETYLFYSGLFAHAPRNALSLERMLAEWLGLPAAVRQFHGQWLALEEPEQSALADAGRPLGLNAQLGKSVIAGQRVWSVENAFRVRLGPMNYAAFKELLPDGVLFARLAQLTRTYAGPQLDFDVQLVLRRDEVPACQLKSGEPAGPRLGWNTWSCSVPRATDAEEPAFAANGRPTR